MSFVQVPPSSTGEKIDVRQIADGSGNNVDRQVVNLGDPSTFGQVAAVTSGNALKVDNSAVTQPISGTITATQGTAAAAAGSWPVEVTDGTNVLGVSAHPVRTDPTGTTTQPVSGTVTANIGTSGSLALDASVTGLQVAQGSTTSGQNGDLVQGAVTTNAPTYTTAKTDPLSLDTSGNLRVSVKDSPANTNAFKVDGSGVTQPVSGTVAATQSGTWTVQPGNTANTTAWKVDGSAVTQPVSGTFFQGTQPVSIAATVVVKADTAGNQANALKVDGSAVTQPVSFGPVTSGGTTAYHAVAAASNNAAAVKASAGQVYGWSIYNNAAYPIYVKLYNKATAPAPATDNALLIKVIGVQAGTHFDYFNACGISGFTNGIGVAAVKGITDTDNTSLVLSDCLIELDYK